MKEAAAEERPAPFVATTVSGPEGAVWPPEKLKVRLAPVPVTVKPGAVENANEASPDSLSVETAATVKLPLPVGG